MCLYMPNHERTAEAEVGSIVELAEERIRYFGDKEMDDFLVFVVGDNKINLAE
jgi:hypothetical protein